MGSLNLVSVNAANFEYLGQLAPGRYTYYITGDTNFIDFQIQNEAETALSGNYSTFPGAEFLEVNIEESGRYYAKVFNSLMASMNYTAQY